MWQTVVVLVLLACALIYVIRHYVMIYRSEIPACSGCSSGCCCGGPKEKGNGCPADTGTVQRKGNEKDHCAAGDSAPDFRDRY